MLPLPEWEERFIASPSSELLQVGHHALCHAVDSQPSYREIHQAMSVSVPGMHMYFCSEKNGEVPAMLHLNC